MCINFLLSSFGARSFALDNKKLSLCKNNNNLLKKPNKKIITVGAA